VLKLGHFEKEIRNTWKVLKCGAGEGWRRSVGPIKWKMKYYRESMMTAITYRQYEGSLNALFTYCLGTAF
jgi:hypothetical protein